MDNLGKRILLLDTDMIIFRFASRNEFVLNFNEEHTGYLYIYKEDNPNMFIHSNLELAKEEIKQYLKQIEEETGLFVVNAISSKSNFRKDFYKEYKANRTGRRPSILEKLREYVIDNFPSIQKEGYEADDLLGIFGMNHNAIISSGDKDMLQIPCDQYNWDTKEFFTISENDAIRFYYKQILLGDSVDNYKGLTGVGDKKAEKILEKAEEHYINYCNKIEDNTQHKRTLESFYLEHIVEEYKKKEMSDGYLNIQMVMAKILQSYDIDLDILNTKKTLLNV